jgi:hypothetical protein
VQRPDPDHNREQEQPPAAQPDHPEHKGKPDRDDGEA